MHDSFTVTAKTGPGIQSSWTAAMKGQAEIPVAIPPQFQGPGSGWSPEDLYAQSLLNCFMATFKVFAEKSSLGFTTLEGEAVLTPGKNEKNQLMMKSILIKARLTGAADKEKAKMLLEKASANCLIMNSVNTEKTLELEIL